MSEIIEALKDDGPPLVRAGIRARRAFRTWRNAKRAKKGLPLKGDNPMFPKNTMRKSGVGLIAASPVVGMILAFIVRLMGVGDECTPEAIEAGCMTAQQISTEVGAIITASGSAVGGALYWRGRNRADEREAAKA